MSDSELRCHACEETAEPPIAPSEPATSGAKWDGAFQRCPRCGSMGSHSAHRDTLTSLREPTVRNGSGLGTRRSAPQGLGRPAAAQLGVFEGDVQRATRKRPSAFGTVL
jgi:hypothetical protein